ncbi:MAG: cystathionine beta-synthase [Candidatus Eremiobacteraeota bacterium]|nr:cystathionine beta-synthase [Candidatus Eremiobacteraeota bacterium]
MQYSPNILSLVGNTPLIQLSRVAAGVRPKILVKAEFLNPGGSIKDRIGLKMLEAAEKSGQLRKGGTIIEPTSGNTGVGLAQAAALKGYRCVFVMPDKMSADKVRLLKAYGAEVVICPTAVPKESPESYYSVSERLSREIPNAFQPNQYANPVNPDTHYQWTGPELWEQTAGKLDVFVAGMGTGGTISGCGRYLKKMNPNITIVGVDSEGSLYTSDKIRPYKVEGIGEDFIPETMDLDIVDEMVTVSDRDSFVTARALAREEGILCGGSCGAAVFGALQYARNLDESKTVVVILPDTGRNYLSKFFSDDYMKENGFWDPRSASISVSELLGKKGDESKSVVTVQANDSVPRAVELMRTYNISQLPVMDDGHMVGSLQETVLMNRIFEDSGSLQKQVRELMSEALPTISAETKVASVYQLLLEGRPAVLVVDEQANPCGIVTKIDLIDHFSRQNVAVHSKN